MFSGIVETSARLMTATEGEGVVQILVERPSDFNDLKVGDSVAVNGICLTIEAFNHESLQFSLAAETLKVTGWRAAQLHNTKVNLERSLRFGDRVHGHLVSGHVDAVGRVEELRAEGESLFVTVSVPAELKVFITPKGSIAINGVSLTVNETKNNSFGVCLIPETLKRTTLANLKVGDPVNLEVDQMAKVMVNWMQRREQTNEI